MMYFRHRNEEEKRLERMVEKREKEERKREKDVMKLIFYWIDDINKKWDVVCFVKWYGIIDKVGFWNGKIE